MKIIFITIVLLSSMLFAGSDFIEIYNSFANQNRYIVNGRIVDEKDKKDKNTTAISSFFNDEKKNRDLYITINKRTFLIQSDNEGYFSFDKTIPLHHNNIITFATKNTKKFFTIKPYFPVPNARIGIISDIDDTIVVSGVTNKIKLLYNTFFKNYKQRELIVETSHKIKLIRKKYPNSALFFISASPNQLNYNIDNFLHYNGFRDYAILTKKIHGTNSFSLNSTISYKYHLITKLIAMYPKIEWILFGDSSEKDEEIYKKVYKEFPHNIKSIYIRDINSKKIIKVL